MKSETRTLVVIPNDPLERYEAKGEVKDRYFNPCDFFDKVLVLPLAKHDSGIETARKMAGRAEVSIHPLGRPGPLGWRRVLRRAREFVSCSAAQVVRGYNPLLMGTLAVKAARACGAASVVSIHADYNLRRNVRIHGPRFLLSARGLYQAAHSLLGLNRTSIGRASHVICAYRFPALDAARWRDGGISVIYNRVDLNSFQPGSRQQNPAAGPLKILTVGRQFAGKDPEPLLMALSRMEHTRMTLVGDGPYNQRLVKLASALGISDRVEFIRRVQHERLPELYRAHDVFAICITHPGVCIPVLEAAASALPVVVNRPLWEPEPEVVGELAEVVEPSPAGYLAAFRNLEQNPSLRQTSGEQLRQRVKSVDADGSERREAEIYRKLCEQVAAGRESRENR